jgi:DNA (cytosine-5)-methyltransferase 1
MKTNEKISIDEFDGKRFQVRLVEPSDDGKAVLTHYLHNIHNGVSKHYKKDALKVLKDYVTYNYTFKFIDLFAGIGGFSLAMQNLRWKMCFYKRMGQRSQTNLQSKFWRTTFW